MDNSEDNKETEDNQKNKEVDKSPGEMNDQAQSQTSEEPSEYSGVAHASMEGTTEQDALGQAYDAAKPSYELEGEDEEEDDKEEGG